MELYQELKTKNGILRGMLHKPDNCSTVPLVILLHGFTGNRVDSKFLFVSFSRYLQERGIACLRFDFLGSGESDGLFHEMTFLKEAVQANLMIDYAKSFDFVSEIILMGFSMGGAVASFISNQRKNDIDKILLWSPAGNMDELAQGYFNNYQILPNGNIDLDGIELGREFYEELQIIDLFSGIQDVNKPVLICHGSQDIGVPYSVGKEYHLRFPNSQFHLIDGADHVYSNLKWRSELFEESFQFITK